MTHVVVVGVVVVVEKKMKGFMNTRAVEEIKSDQVVLGFNIRPLSVRTAAIILITTGEFHPSFSSLFHRER